MDKIWLKNYPAGVPAEIDIDHIPSLAALIENACREFAERTAYVFMGKAITYRELDEASSAFAGYLQSRGIQKGDRVALMMPNMLQYPIALFGCIRAGAVVVNTNPLYTPRELEFVLNDSGATAIVVVENFAHTLQQVMAKTSVRTVVVTPLGEMLSPLKRTIVNFVVRRVKKMVPAWSIPSAVSFRAALSVGRGRGAQPVALEQSDLAFLQYTGGTTGVPKAAMLTHRNIASNVVQAHTWIRPLLHAEHPETILTALPLYHIFALTANCLVFLMIGARNLLIANPRDIPNLIKEWSSLPISAFTGVNTLFNALLNHPDFAKLDFSTLRVALGGGMAVQAPVANKWRETTGASLIQAYGLTETSPAATINPMDAIDFNGTIGLPISSTEVSVRDEEGQDVPLGEVGEICIRGPQVMAGYWQRPDETAKVMWADGFLRTGDLGFMCPNGYVTLVDRKKNMILVSGFNVYPNEVEEAAVQHPSILECAAIGEPDEKSGEVVKLFVVLRPGASLTAEEVISHCKELLTNYKVPRLVEFRTELPKTNVGKILHRALRRCEAVEEQAA